MNKEFVSYEQALALKELGFNELCLGRYCVVTECEKTTGKILLQYIDCTLSENNLVKAPLKQQVFSWFRGKYHLFGCIDLQVCTPAHWFIRVDNITENDYAYHSEDDNLKFKTYEEAESACIDKLIELVKNK